MNPAVVFFLDAVAFLAVMAPLVAAYDAGARRGWWPR